MVVADGVVIWLGSAREDLVRGTVSLNLYIRACQEEFRMRRQLSSHPKPISAKYFVVCQKGFGSQKARQRSSMCSKQKRLHPNFAP